MLLNELSFVKLDGELNATTAEDLKAQFQNLLKSKIGREYHSIVYQWRTQKPIPRLYGESPIIYIGKTKNSLFIRHHGYAKLEASGSNWRRYEYIIKNYGSIIFECAKCEYPKKIEKELINEYFQNHLEVPPLNLTR